MARFMFNSEQYRAKAAEYKEREETTDAPNDVREFKNLERTFTEMPTMKNGWSKISRRLFADPPEIEKDSRAARDRLGGQ
jgi:hypothetical protein